MTALIHLLRRMRRHPSTFSLILVRRIQVQDFATLELPAGDVRTDGEFISGVVEHPGIEPRSGATFVPIDVDGEIGLLGQCASGEVVFLEGGLVEGGVVVVDTFDGDGVVGGGRSWRFAWGRNPRGRSRRLRPQGLQPRGRGWAGEPRGR